MHLVNLYKDRLLRYMQKLSILLCGLLLITLSAFSQTEKVKQTIIGNKVELLVPAGFSATDAINATAFNKEHSFTDHTGKIKLVFAYSNDGTVTDNDIPEYTNVLIKEMKGPVPSFKLLDDGIHLQDGKNIGYIKYTVKDESTTMFRYQFYISVEDKLLMFIFSCPEKMRQQWEADVDIIANSVRVIQPE